MTMQKNSRPSGGAPGRESTQAMNSSCEAQAHSNIFEGAYQGKMALKPKEAAPLIGVGINRIYELCHRQDFPAIQVGSGYIIPVSGLQRWLDLEAGATGAGEGGDLTNGRA
jgi:excisionase family DNA binding protein